MHGAYQGGPVPTGSLNCPFLNTFGGQLRHPSMELLNLKNITGLNSLVGRFTPGLFSYNLHYSRECNIRDYFLSYLEPKFLQIWLCLTFFKFLLIVFWSPHILRSYSYLVGKFYLEQDLYFSAQAVQSSVTGYQPVGKKGWWRHVMRKTGVILQWIYFRVVHIWSPGKGRLFSSVRRKWTASSGQKDLGTIMSSMFLGSCTQIFLAQA